MIETEMQALVVKAVQVSGGQAMKLQNEYIKGVVDLLIKLPSKPAFIAEAKRMDFAASTIIKAPQHRWELDVTQLQKNFLRDWFKAGMAGCILSFVQEKGGNVNSLRMALYSYQYMTGNGWTATLVDHKPLGTHLGRSNAILEQLHVFATSKDF